MFVPRALPAICLTALVAAGSAMADARTTAVAQAFADHCFNPRLTAQTAQAGLGPSGARIDFYDLRPFSSVPPSQPTVRPQTPGTDRRCEVASDGYHFEIAQHWVDIGLDREGLLHKNTDVPANFPIQSGTTAISAVQLNPNRIAVIQIGLRKGPNGNETFINVERLVPLDEVSK